MSFHIDDEKLFEKYKAIWTKIGNLKNSKLNALPIYDNKYIKTKIKTSSNKVYTNFQCLNVTDDNIQSILLILYLQIF